MEIVPDPAEFENPQEWRKGASEQGFAVPEELTWLLYDLMEDSDRTMSDAFSWLLDRAMLSRHGAEYPVADGAGRLVAGAMREEKARRLPKPSWEKVDGEMIVDFPADGDFRPYVGFIYAIRPDGEFDEVGPARDTVSLPGGVPLSLQVMSPGKYGRPFHGLPPDLFDEIFATAFEPANDDDLEAISDLYGARVVNLGYLYPAGLLVGHGMRHEVSDDGVSHLDAFDRLEVFGLKSYEVTDRGLTALVGKRSLRELRLCYAAVTPTGIRQLPLEQFTVLTVEYTNTIGSDLSFLGRCHRLESLGLRIADVGDEQLRHVGALAGLRTLDLGHNRPDERFGVTQTVTDRGVRHLRDLTGLTNLWLDATGVTDGSGQDLQRMTSLNRLSLSQTDITDRTLASVGKLTNLEALDLYDTRVTSAGLRALTGLDRLRSLTLSHTAVDDGGLDYLTRLSSLEDLSLTDTGVTLAGLRRLTALPNLNRLKVMYLTEDPDEQAKFREQFPGVAVWFDL